MLVISYSDIPPFPWFGCWAGGARNFGTGVGEERNCSSEFSPHSSQNYRQTDSRCQTQTEQAFNGKQIPIL